MRKLLITLNDELDTLLAGEKNQNETVREALRLYKQDITTDTIDGFRASYALVAAKLKELDAKIDFIARKVQ